MIDQLEREGGFELTGEYAVTLSELAAVVPLLEEAAVERQWNTAGVLGSGPRSSSVGAGVSSGGSAASRGIRVGCWSR